MGTMVPRFFWLRDGARLTVRTAREDDALDLLELGRALVREKRYSVTTPEEFTFTEEDEQVWIKRNRDEPDHVLLVAETDGPVVGLVGIDTSPRRRLSHRATLRLSVAREWRGQGVGTALVGCALDWAAGHPRIEKVSLAVLADNAPAIALYRRFGFEEEGRRPREVKRGPGSYVDDILLYRFVKEVPAGNQDCPTTKGIEERE